MSLTRLPPMCNEQARRVALGQLRNDWSETKIPLLFPEGLPNLAPLDSIRITDRNAIIRAAFPADRVPGDAPRPAPFEAELVVRRWSWPGPSGKPVYNFRSEGRAFSSGATGGRCLIVADAFYEFRDTPADAPEPDAAFALTPTPPPAARRAKKKAKYRFTLRHDAGEPDWFCIAGIWRTHSEVGEAYTMLTCAPGPDIAPYHHRQVVTLTRPDWARWLDPAVPAAEVLKPAPAGSFTVERVA